MSENRFSAVTAAFGVAALALTVGCSAGVKATAGTAGSPGTAGTGVGGTVGMAGTVGASCIARWSNSTWSALTAGHAVDATVRALEIYDDGTGAENGIEST